MFIRKSANGYYFLAETVRGKEEYRESIGLDPDSWLQTEILKATATMNMRRVDDLRKVQKRRLPVFPPTPENCHLGLRALENVVITDLPFGLADAIITDPPYGEEYLDVYDILAAKSVELVKPGGSVVVMVGQSYLPEVLTKLCQRLTYQWVVAYLTPGGQSAQLWTRKVNTFWKPILWFVNGEYEGHWIGDVAKSAVNDNDKRFHQWGQSESGMADLVRRFSKRGDFILDPFMGAGTTGKVALDLGRRFVGFDKDEGSVKEAKRRLGLKEYDATTF